MGLTKEQMEAIDQEKLMEEAAEAEEESKRKKVNDWDY